MRRRFLALFALPMLALTLAGCPQQQTTSLIITGVASSLQAFGIVYGASPALTKTIAVAQQAAQQIAALQPGSPTQDTIQILEDLSTDLSAIAKPNDKAAQLIALLSKTVAGVLSDYGVGAPITTNALTQSRTSMPEAILIPKTQAQLKSQWNSIVASDPSLAVAKLK